MEGFCSRCGDCCDNITFNMTPEDLQERYDIYAEWAWYYADYPDFEPEEGQPTVANVQEHLDNICFISRFWHEQRKGIFSCDWFDTDTRTCTAHDARPPVCRDFPWYNKKDEYVDKDVPIQYNRCGYWYDVPQEKWPEGLKLLPIV